MGKKIKSFSMSPMSLGARVQFHQMTIKNIKAVTAVVLHIDALFPAYEKAVKDLVSVVNRQRAFVITRDLETADTRRGDAHSIIRTAIKNYRKSLIESKRRAAVRLYAKISGYLHIRNHERAKETAEVNGMLEALNTEESRADLETLGLTEDVEALAEANRVVEEMLEAKMKESSEHVKQSEKETKELIEAVNKLYAEIVEVVNAYAIIEPTEGMDTFIDDMNGLVKMFVRIAKTGTSGGSSTGDKEGEVDGSGSSDGTDAPNGSEDTDDSGESGNEGGSSSDTTPDSGETGGTTPPPTTGGGDDDEEIVG